jgi:hypothetical protein
MPYGDPFNSSARSKPALGRIPPITATGSAISEALSGPKRYGIGTITAKRPITLSDTITNQFKLPPITATGSTLDRLTAATSALSADFERGRANEPEVVHIRRPLTLDLSAELEELERHQEAAAARRAEAERARVAREKQMLDALEAVRGVLVESAEREAVALQRAEQAEAREIATQERADARDTLMIRITVASAVIAFLSLLAALVM